MGDPNDTGQRQLAERFAEWRREETIEADRGMDRA